MFQKKKDILQILVNLQNMQDDVDRLEEEVNKQGILLNKINDSIEKLLFSQDQKSESKGIFGIKKRK